MVLDVEDCSYSNSKTENASAEEERDEVKEVQNMSRKDTRRIRAWRFVATGILLLTALAVTLTTFKFLDREEVSDFETAFDQFSRTVANAALEHQQRIRLSLSTFASVVSTQAKVQNATWPFFTFRNFEIVAGQVMKQASLELAAIHNLVPEDLKEEYSNYTLQNYAKWVNESLQTSEEAQKDFSPVGFKPYIWGRGPDGPYADMGRESSYSIWTISPIPTNYGLLNWNAITLPDFKAMDEAMHVLKNETVFVGIRPYAAFNEEAHKKMHAEGQDPNSFPHTFMWHPIHENAEDYNSKIVGAAGGAMAYDASMRNLLPRGVQGIVCVLRNNFNQTFSYSIDGPEAYFLGMEDFHDPKYDHMKREVDLALHTNPAYPTTPGHCMYRMEIYPSSEFEAAYHSNVPKIYAGVVASTFLLIAVAFVIYDLMVQRRNEKIVLNAARSNAIVSSLFPSQIRDRLIGASNENNAATLNSPRNLKAFLKSKGTGSENEYFDSKPLADLFLEVTVIFADIVGFTAWSSVREPSQVFMLLERVYGEFDTIAKKRRVFKVETVGDCYVAATGMPDQRKDHALSMIRFAKDIMNRMYSLTGELEVVLGPDTGDLSLRIGIHSGPVTAGVLRGERARFQLFGDTMNTAARIESSGQSGRIHVSQETADLIVKGGKSSWIVKRDETVNAKGKGDMQTYWVKHSVDKDEGSNDDSTSSPVDRIDYDTMISERKNRLIDWNVESLLQLIRQIVAHREARGMLAKSSDHRDETLAIGSHPLDDVKEIISLPEFDTKTARRKRTPDQIEIPAEVVSQLRYFVACIASMYRNNSFHNFEHASHVTMSVLKLLSRIVAPTELEIENDGEGNEVAATLHDHTYGITSDPMTQFACAFSALIHDVDHTGVPNAQLVKEDTQLAAVYKGRSVAEQNSLVLSWELLMDSRFSELRGILFATPSELEHFRQLIINIVLATDIVDKDLKALRNGRWDKAFKSPETAISENITDQVNRKATIVIEHLIQASDVSHTMQHWHVYRKWNECFFRECYAAYKAGRAENDPSLGWYKGEMGFFDFYIIPLAKKLKECGVFGKSSDEYLNYALQNRKEWESRGQEVVAEMLEAINRETAEKAHT